RTVNLHDDVVDHLDAGYPLDELVPYRPENEITRRYVPVNWSEAFKTQSDDVEWLVEDFIEASTLSAIYSAPGVGKSLLALEIAVDIVRSGKIVIYIDQENRVADTVERLSSFGVRPEELDRLLLYSFPSLPPLDSAEGGRHILALADTIQPALLIMDTLSRMVAGAENDADTYLSLYRNTLAPLKGRGIATLRLDHSGKNESAGQRGSSSKSGDIDVLWWLHRDGESAFSLECQKSRSGHIPFGTIINLNREYDPLRHQWHVRVDIPLSRYEAVMRKMDEYGISPSLGRDAVRKILRDNNITGVRNDQLQAAIIERRNRQGRLVPPVRDGSGHGGGGPF
ncbi:MAG TPA: AAA family ATPase, partial [Puia sp.]|nr:AAA family ATPase [Puia sp.]